LNISNRKRFEAIDTIFTGFTNFFIVNPVKETPIYKEFEILGLKDNTEEIRKITAEIGEILSSRSNENFLSGFSSPQYKALSAKVDKLSEEKACFGNVKKEYNILTEEIKVTIETANEVKKFVYGSEDTMDDLLDYMQNLSKVAREEYQK